MNHNARSLHNSASHTALGGNRLLHDPTLQRLLDLLGGAQSIAFLARMQVDLASAGTALRRAVAGHDRDGLRRASHDLIALAGTVGAREMETAARRLNAAARDADQAAFGHPATLAARLTDRLVAELDTVRAQHKTATTPATGPAG